MLLRRKRLRSWYIIPGPFSLYKVLQIIPARSRQKKGEIFMENIGVVKENTVIDALRNGIPLPEQQPSEDSISRKAESEELGMYNNRYVTELSISEVKEYYEILRENRKLTHEESADFGICKERLIDYAYKNIDKVNVLDKIKAEIKDWQIDNENDAETHDFVFERIYEIFDEYKTEKEG